MVEPTTAIESARTEPTRMSLKQLLQQPAYRNRFNAMLGERAAQFMASVINVASAPTFRNVEPTSILAAAAVAATLDLPIDKNLGFAWIVPYGKLAQFQIGYKGYIQLALRSGQYAGMNAATINAEAFGGYDTIGDPIILWDKLDETKPAIGYAFAWRLTSGFSKIVYWSKEKMLAHAARYSQAYRANRQDSTWFTDPDKMGLKTVISNGIRRWGILSIELKTAVERDQSAAIDIEARPVYIDNEGDEEAPPADQVKRADEQPAAPDFSVARSRLRDVFDALVEAQTLKIAKDTLEVAARVRDPDRVPDEQIEEAISALIVAVNKSGNRLALRGE